MGGGYFSSFIPDGGAVSSEEWAEGTQVADEELGGTWFGLRFADQLKAIREGDEARVTPRPPIARAGHRPSRRRQRRIDREAG